MTVYTVENKLLEDMPVTASTELQWIDSETYWWMRIEPENRSITGKAYIVVKRCFDLTLVVLSLPFLLLAILLIALLIKIESPTGPVFFLQKRTGKDGRRFLMFKFRTMVPNAEELKAQLMHLNELQAPDFKIKNDPRITRVGKFLRKTSLDELPQIINILKGEMSLVGPRPTSFAPETYKPWHLQRLEVTPGLTGLWQVTGRSDIEFDDRVRLDIQYIKRQCLWLDFQILLRTALAVIKHEGAY